MEQATIEIQGMSCGHCVKAVREALEGVPDVAVERVELGSASVVTFDQPSEGVADQLVEARRDAGYDGRVADGPTAS